MICWYRKVIDSVTSAKSNIVSTDDDTEVQQQSVGTKKAIIIGDSMVKQIIPEHLLPKKYGFQIQKHTVYHIDDIPGLINSLDGFKDNCTCVIHCGTNDITSLPVDVIANKLKDVVNLALEKNPNVNVIISNIVPWGNDHMIDITRQKLNIRILKEFNNCGMFVGIFDNSNLASRGFINNKFFAQDKVHLNEIGTKVLAANIGSYLRKINGIPQRQQPKKFRQGPFRRNRKLSWHK